MFAHSNAYFTNAHRAFNKFAAVSVIVVVAVVVVGVVFLLLFYWIIIIEIDVEQMYKFLIENVQK